MWSFSPLRFQAVFSLRLNSWRQRWNIGLILDQHLIPLRLIILNIILRNLMTLRLLRGAKKLIIETSSLHAIFLHLNRINILGDELKSFGGLQLFIRSIFLKHRLHAFD